MRKAKKIFMLKNILIGCKIISLTRIMTLVREEVLANLVPAAAVIREGRALSGMSGRKGFVGGNCCYKLKL